MSDARLHVTDSQGRRVVALDRPLFLIGRRTSADLQIISTDVSREHAEIAHENGRHVLRDRASRYGTFVNGDQITERLLQHGDRIRLGRTDAIELVFMTEGAKTTGFLDTAASDAGALGQVAAILSGLAALGSGVLEEVLARVMDLALEVTKAERGFMMLANAEGELEFRIARGRNRTTLPGTSFTTSEKIPREVFRTGQSRIVGDLMESDWKGQHDGTIAVGIRHVLCVPLRVTPISSAGAASSPRVIGVLYLDGRERSTMLSEVTRTSLEAFAQQAAMAVDSARLYAESDEKRRTDRELQIAAGIQRDLLPDGVFESPVIDLAAESIPCRTVGGDFYDYIEVAEGSFGFALGDVAGKGPPAALLAAAVQSNFAALAPISTNPADAMARVNKALLRRAIDARFATMFYGAITDKGCLSYCTAGQEPPLVVGRNSTRWLETGGPVLGLLASATYEFDSLVLEPGDLVVVCSDGVTEARNRAGDEFGRDRLLEAVRTRHGGRPEEVLKELTLAVKQFSEGEAQGDDITALVLRYKG